MDTQTHTSIVPVCLLRNYMSDVCNLLPFRGEGKSVCWGQALRLLSLMDALVSQRACKSATLHLLSGSVSGDEQLADVFPLLSSLLVPPTDHSIHQQQCSVLVGTILQSLCDQVKVAIHIKQKNP